MPGFFLLFVCLAGTQNYITVYTHIREKTGRQAGGGSRLYLHESTLFYCLFYCFFIAIYRILLLLFGAASYMVVWLLLLLLLYIEGVLFQRHFVVILYNAPSLLLLLVLLLLFQVVNLLWNCLRVHTRKVDSKGNCFLLS